MAKTKTAKEYDKPIGVRLSKHVLKGTDKIAREMRITRSSVLQRMIEHELHLCADQGSQHLWNAPGE